MTPVIYTFTEAEYNGVLVCRGIECLLEVSLILGGGGVNAASVSRRLFPARIFMSVMIHEGARER